MENCIFCKIANKELPSEIIYEDGNFISFKDISPKAPTHFLIIPKKHIESVNHLQPGDREMVGQLLLIAKKISEEKKLTGYRLVINVGRKGGQLIDHLHLHLLSGETITLP
ncbi:MAG: histidine triad nucleotide-binding protein [Candidatus Staskawiczbacteria bacterium CG10_big_fil_rev_8_21_14_0_10_38_10]|uniref:Histidine triad nucleotide-binding protein n=1 Tax=Candidatus Staskawiczbacteria bacterium CG10_big_fil_rev_8_21_14_0_10_38_10 TaxID=1974891 RepID=A0A2H9T1W9_9BACT|nr:MAG: histidine triad nucleotide-binding protein [Candidatus Staskawiczbacteria bacterium CG10_big_fil_rev_8_21_14_0_10_38_10]